MQTFEYISDGSKSWIRLDLFTEYDYDGVEEGIILSTFVIAGKNIESNLDCFTSVEKAKSTFRRMCVFLINKINLE